MQRVRIFIILLLIFLNGCTQKVIRPSRPGIYADYTLLPNGWKLTPAGEQISTNGDLPLNMVFTPDSMHIILSNSGASTPSLTVIDLRHNKQIQSLQVAHTWRGMVFGPRGRRLYLSGGRSNRIHVYGWQKDSLFFIRDIHLTTGSSKEVLSISGMDFHKASNTLLCVTRDSNELYAVNIQNDQVQKKIRLPGKAYEILVHPNQKFACISIWDGAQIAIIDLESFQIKRLVRTGSHPSEMVLSKNGDFLFTANANVNTVTVINLKQMQAIETLSTALQAQALTGSTPNSLAISNDGNKLFVANADNNCLAVFNISHPGNSQSLGFIPTGWYPTVVRFNQMDSTLLVANGKGLFSLANPNGPRPGVSKPNKTEQYIAQLFHGVVSKIHWSVDFLKQWTIQVYQNTPFTYQKSKAPQNSHIVPASAQSGPSPQIKYVFYIIKENRTYDQVFGDIAEGNGDSSLCLFGQAITPNQHQLAREYALFDNFYVDAEVSADGHNWSTAAYATDYTEKTWPVMYGGRGGKYEFEGGVPAARPDNGYIWDNALNHGVSLRDYGEFAHGASDNPGFYLANDAYMQPYLCATFPGFDLKISDTTRYRIWREDFDDLIRKNAVPALNIIRFPQDHTAGTAKGFPTVQAMVADNDYGVGLFIEYLSHSKIWKKSAVFIVEDDAQNGSDHVDAHRSTLLVISPYIRRGYVDHTMYSTGSVIKTMELILGLPYMTQFDMAATAIRAPFTNKLSHQSYTAISPTLNLKTMNTPNMYGAIRCEQFNFKQEDAIPDVEFNEIIWKAVHGKTAQMPTPVRGAFVRYKINEDE